MAYLAERKRRKIENIINRVKGSATGCYPLLTLEEMAKKCGIRVFESDLKDIAEGRKLSGVITYRDPKNKAKPRIFIESDMTPERKKFALAHELGHHLLHKGEKFRLDNFDGSTILDEKEQESEANYFAASLLMPTNTVLRKISEGRTVGELAGYFGVSVAAVRSRIKWVSG